jgi:hypothetical protein
MYIPGQPIFKGAKASRILDPMQIQYYYDLLYSLHPFPMTTPTVVTCNTYVSYGILLFFLHGQPTLEVNVEAVCQVMFASFVGFIAGNPPTLDVTNGINPESRLINQQFIHIVQQAYLAGTPTPVQDIPYQPTYTGTPAPTPAIAVQAPPGT